MADPSSALLATPTPGPSKSGWSSWTLGHKRWATSSSTATPFALLAWSGGLLQLNGNCHQVGFSEVPLPPCKLQGVAARRELLNCWLEQADQVGVCWPRPVPSALLQRAAGAQVVAVSCWLLAACRRISSSQDQQQFGPELQQGEVARRRPTPKRGYGGGGGVGRRIPPSESC